jgi:hypothetical protein
MPLVIIPKSEPEVFALVRQESNPMSIMLLEPEHSSRDVGPGPEH